MTDSTPVALGDRTFHAALDTANEVNGLVRGGKLADDHPAVVGARDVADAVMRIHSGEPELIPAAAAVGVARELGRLVGAGVLAGDHPAVVAAVVTADALRRIRAGEPEPVRTDMADAAALLLGDAPTGRDGR